MTDSPAIAGGSARPEFSSFLTTVLTLLGVAVGLGNVWRFPYMMGAYGGSAFLAVYLVLIFTVAVPALMAELALARSTRGATITVMHASFGRFGLVLGYLLVFGVAAAGSYYVLIVGNVLYSAWFVLVRGFEPANLARYAAGLDDAPLQYAIAVGVLWAGLGVIDRGLKRGIERLSLAIVPVFYVVACYLVFAALRQPGAGAAFLEFLQPDFANLGTEEVFAALGQCFFSVGLGATFMLVYGKFLRRDTALSRMALSTALGDTGASLLVAAFLVPSVVVVGLQMDSGPRLLFETVPAMLARMQGGRIAGIGMLVALTLIAFLSVVALLQVVIVGLEERLGQDLRRRRLIVTLGVIETLAIAYPASNPAVIGPLDLVFGSGFMVVGGTAAVIAVTWRMARAQAETELFGRRSGPGTRLLFLWMRWAVPFILLAILVPAIRSFLSN